MIVALWILNALLAAGFFVVGGIKVARSKSGLLDSGQLWVSDYSERALKLIGTAELLGAAGLILPLLTGIAPALAPLAAACLTMLMIAATVINLRRGDPTRSSIAMGVPSAASAVLGFSILA